MWTWTITDYVRAGDSENVIKRLEAGDDINERRSGNYTPLVNAVYYNKCEMIELLLDKDADIEAVDRSELSALRTVIYYKNEEVAILLADGGTDPNILGYQQLSALHAAVQQSQIPVVKALLLAGADSTIVSGSGKIAMEHVHGSCAQELINLLTSFTSLELALATRSSDGVGVLLKKALSEGASIDNALHAYKTTMSATAATEGAWKDELSEVVEQFEGYMLNYALRSGSTEYVDSVNMAIGKPEWVSTARLDPDGRNALHAAALRGDVAIVAYLLESHKCDSTASDDHGCKAVDLAKENNERKHITWILTEHEKKTKFLDLPSQMLGQNEVTLVELRELPQLMTSIYDLRILFFIADGALTKREMKQLLQNAFAEATVLRERKRRDLISLKEKDEWEIEARHVNAENADWVREIQNSLARLENRVAVAEKNILSLNENCTMLRDALENKIRLDKERMRRRQLIGLVTCSLCLCGGSLIGGALNWAFDACETAEAFLTELTEISSEELASTLGVAINKTVVKPGVGAILEQACIDKTEFSSILGEAIALEKADETKALVAKRTEDGKTTENMEFLPASQSVKPKLHLRDVVQMVRLELDTKLKQQNRIRALVDYGNLTETDLEAYPYHYVVLHSSGDLTEFKELAKHIGSDDGDADATMETRVPENPSGFAFGEQGTVHSAPISWKTVQASPASYASYLGYADIVQWFLESGPTSKRSEWFAQKKEKSCITIDRARSISKSLQTTTTTA